LMVMEFLSLFLVFFCGATSFLEIMYFMIYNDGFRSIRICVQNRRPEEPEPHPGASGPYGCAMEGGFNFLSSGRSLGHSLVPWSLS
jgi:hypothetical protein